MAWASAHFAMGMACSGAAGLVVCAIRRRQWRALPFVMTAGGLWAMVPDMPRLFRVDFPSLGLAETLGSRELEKQLHAMGDLFFFHHAMDVQPREFALHGMFVTILLYNICLGFALFRRKQRKFDLRMVGESPSQTDLAWPATSRFHAESPPLRLTESEYEKTPGP